MSVKTAKKKKSPEPKHVSTSSTLARSNTFFIQLKQYGYLDAKGKVLMGFSGFPKWSAKPDKPLCTLILPMIERLMERIDYSGADAMKADVEQFKRAVSQWTVKP